MRLRHLLLALFPLACLAPAGAAAQQPVVAVEIQGLRNVPEELVRALLLTRPGVLPTPERLAADVASLEEIGFFEEVLPPAVEPNPEGPRVTFRVREFPLVVAIRFVGNTVLTDAELLAALPLRVGQAFNIRQFEESFAALERAYRARGYLALAGAEDLALLREAGVVLFEIRELRVERVEFEGLVRTRPEAARRFLQLREGDLFREPTLAADAARLLALGPFVAVEPRVEVLAPGRAALTWVLEERPPRDLRASVGVSPRERAIGVLEYTDVNFRGRLERFRLAAVLGAIDARAGGTVEYFNPWIAAPGVTLLARGFSEPRYRFTRELLAGEGRYFERRDGGQLLVTRPRGRTRLSLGVRAEDVSLRGLPLAEMAPAPASADGLILLFSSELARDTRDEPLNPTRGSVTVAGIEEGFFDREAGGFSWVARARVEHRRYLPLGAVPPEEPPRRGPPVLALRAVGGTSLGRLPFFEQFFLGGLADLRGYREDRFWGEHLLLLNAEARWPLLPWLAGVVFVDVGDAWGSGFQFLPGVETEFGQHRGFAPRVGYGAGLRFATPVGPARLDLGIGEAVRLHFALGTVF